MTEEAEHRPPLVARPFLRFAEFLRRRSPVALAFAFLAGFLSLTPSLLPRTGMLQTLATGISMICGYAAGYILHWGFAHIGIPHEAFDRVARRIAGQNPRIVIILLMIIEGGAVWSLTWQGDLREQMGIDQLAWVDLVAVPLGALLMLVLAIELVHAITWLWRRITHFGQRWLPIVLARVTATIVVVLVVVLMVNGVLLRGVKAGISDYAETRNDSIPSSQPVPESPLVSGGRESSVSWESLGYQGRAFITQTPTAQEISAVTGKRAEDPIRAYSGYRLDEPRTRTAQRVVDELERTGAFDRSVLLIYNTTGTGWVDESYAKAVEYYTGGDCATASMQYSFLPSGAAFLFEQQDAIEGAQALYDAIYTVWSKLPPDHRPHLLLGGESLGAFGGLTAAASTQSLVDAADGSVWTGTPSFTETRTRLLDEREAGSSTMAPTLPERDKIKFARDTHDLDALEGDASAQNLFLQHPTDAVVWWSTDLLFRRPDWLGSARGDATGVQRDMTWTPVVTFWQVTCDLPFSADMPPGYGHRYTSEVIQAWGVVLGEDPGTIDTVTAALS